MAIPAIPLNFYLQSGDGRTFLSWQLMPGATSYSIQRSTDGVTYAVLGTASTNSYLDTTVTVGTLYYYQVASVNGSGTSSYCSPQNIIPTAIGKTCLGAMRLEAQQRCDRVNSNFVTLPEWNSYLTNSYKELYDILIQKFGDDYFVANTYSFTTDGGSQLYPLPGDFYKLFGVEVALNPADPNSWVTLRKFEFIQRNLWNFPNVYTFYGITNLRYRINGNNLYIVPIASANQTIRIWYAPRPVALIQDTDTIDGVSGWEEYIIVDACIKALAKEESDTSVFMAQKAQLMKRIEEAGENRDIGEPETVSDSKRRNFAWGEPGDGYGSGGMW